MFLSSSSLLKSRFNVFWTLLPTIIRKIMEVALYNDQMAEADCYIVCICSIPEVSVACNDDVGLMVGASRCPALATCPFLFIIFNYRENGYEKVRGPNDGAKWTRDELAW
jgi:hypothetical protein